MSDDRHESGKGRSARLCWHREQLAQFLAELRYASNVRQTIAQAFQRALYHGFECEEIRTMIRDLAQTDLPHSDAILPVLQDLTSAEIAIDAHPPELKIGQQVRVILNERNQTLREGPVADRIWHHKDRRWIYFIKSQGRPVSKRYYIDDLKALVPMKIEDIPTATFNLISDELVAAGWKVAEEYNGFDAWIDYGLLVLRKGDAVIRMEWDNWMEGSIEGPDDLLQEIQVRHSLK